MTPSPSPSSTQPTAALEPDTSPSPTPSATPTPTSGATSVLLDDPAEASRVESGRGQSGLRWQVVEESAADGSVSRRWRDVAEASGEGRGRPLRTALPPGADEQGDRVAACPAWVQSSGDEEVAATGRVTVELVVDGAVVRRAVRSVDVEVGPGERVEVARTPGYATPLASTSAVACEVSFVAD